MLDSGFGMSSSYGDINVINGSIQIAHYHRILLSVIFGLNSGPWSPVLRKYYMSCKTFNVVPTTDCVIPSFLPLGFGRQENAFGPPSQL